MNKVSRQFGGVSLFIVIFVALITTAVSVSFTQMMIRNQQQVTASDLSGRAYDSALAGVEDAKRLLVAMYKKCSNTADPSNAVECSRLRSVINNSSCAAIIEEFGGTVNPETRNLEKSVGDTDANQAYTCVKIALATEEYTDRLTVSETTMLPLRSEDEFNGVRITWFTKEDAGGATSPSYTAAAPQLPQAGTNEWRTNNPSLLRLQLIPGAVNTSQLDQEAKTVYLYPRNAGTNTSADFNSDIDSGANLAQIRCSSSSFVTSNVNGVCTAIISMNPTKSAYLQLATFYNSTHFTIELLNGSTPVKFDSVQPVVDATGRADNLFRRVEAKVKVGAVSIAYPEGTVQTGTNFCKAFTYQENQADGGYEDGGCEP